MENLVFPKFGTNEEIWPENFVWKGPKINKYSMILYHSTESICPEKNLIPKCFRIKDIMIISFSNKKSCYLV